MMKKGLTAKEKLFCAFYVSLGNYSQAAESAGYDNPAKNGLTLLMREDIDDEINRIYQKQLKSLKQKARFGYERLAFGNVDDAVKLLFADNPSEEDLSKYDLFNVAEIKRPKDGAMEIKFFDRIKALEKLELSESSEQHGSSDFYNAIIGGIRNCTEGGSDDE